MTDIDAELRNTLHKILEQNEAAYGEPWVPKLIQALRLVIEQRDEECGGAHSIEFYNKKLLEILS